MNLIAKTTLEEITESPEEMRLYLRERAYEYVTAMICRVMKEKKVTRSELARRLGKVPGWVTQALNEDTNKELKTLSDLLWALGETLEFSHRPIADVSGHATPSNGRHTWSYVNTVPWGERIAPLPTGARHSWHKDTRQVS